MIETSKRRAYLKSLAMTMDPIFQIGKNSLTPEFTAAVDEALAARELRQAKSGALIIQTSDDEFYIVGINARFSFGFRGQNQGKVLNNSVKGQIAGGRVLHEVVEEGTFKDGVWIPGRRLRDC